ncbi:MAG TPA: hypothetical protein VE954_13620 [Oligoflexus sp.]|uniref:hypothetical protein n=1 Tax=Oligoflexus sp. TaxID=1971216 RepID=UPI002D358E3F|nr:hypothetical protein [Oligoflexus sp.]HYX34138.1 hypothetical protein [Oligoflexus sp.]
MSGKHESSFSRMLNRPDNLTIAKGCLNRTVRRRLAALGKKANKTQALVIVDATLMGRHGKYVKNIGFYKLGRKTVCGHNDG